MFDVNRQSSNKSQINARGRSENGEIGTDFKNANASADNYKSPASGQESASNRSHSACNNKTPRGLVVPT